MPSYQKKIFYVALNWGLGHASRSIPIIKELIKQNCELILGSDGRAGILLQKEFPELEYIELPPYNIHYAGHFVWSMGTQLPKILLAIRKEKQFLDQLFLKRKFDVIISDNRYGCFHKNCHSIFLTHQLNIQLPFLGGSYFASKSIKRLIRNFDTCWVPDFPGEPNLAGKLAHGKNTEKLIYIGSLSRMQYQEKEEIYDAVAVLSGPEPERSRLEKIILKQMQEHPGNFALVKGITDNNNTSSQILNVKIFPYLLSKDLNELMLSAKVIICRSGYSSLMDLAKLRKPAILIPTPGQTEQEYLADRMLQQGVFYQQKQQSFDLKLALHQYKSFQGLQEKDNENILLQKIIQEMLSM